jgi:predicted nucleic acid-binding protein
MILDTNAVSAVLAGDADVARVLGTASHHHLPWIVLGEYQFGLCGSRQQTRLRRLLQKLESESLVLFPDRRTVDEYAIVRYALKQKGRPIPENDIWISAVARQHHLPIVSSDSHFDDVPGVIRLGW